MVSNSNSFPRGAWERVGRAWERVGRAWERVAGRRHGEWVVPTQSVGARKTYRRFIPLVLILLLAALLRVGWPTLTEFKFSEARLAALALEWPRTGHLPLVGVPSSAGFDHSPFSVYLYLPAFLFTANPIPATVYGGLAGVAAVALTWRLARRWPGEVDGRWAAPIAALLLAVNPWAVAFSRKIWQVAFVPFLVLLFLALAVAALVERQRWSLSGAVVVLALLIQVHPSAVSLAVALALWLLIFGLDGFQPWPVVLGELLLGGALGLLTAAPFLLHQVQSDWPLLAALRALPAARWDPDALRLGWEAVTGRGIAALAGEAAPQLTAVLRLGRAFQAVGLLVAAAALLLGWRMVRNWRADDARRQRAARVDLILLSALLLPLLLNLRHNLHLHLHFFALILPPACLIAGRGAAVLFDRWPSRALRAAVLTALGLLVAGQVAALVLTARFVAGHETPGGFGTPLRDYLAVADELVAAAQESGAAEVLIVGEGDSVVVDGEPAIFDVLLRDRAAYRFVDGRMAALFPPHRALALLTPAAGETVRRWYAPWPARSLAGGYRLVALDGGWPQAGLTAIAGPRLFQNGIEAQGYRWEAREAGDSGVFWLLWQVLWLDEVDSHFSVQVLDGEGRVLGRQDGVGYPTAQRRKGDRVVSGFDITVEHVSNLLDSGQVGTLSNMGRVGVYRYPSLVPVPLIDAGGQPVGDAVIVGPLP